MKGRNLLGKGIEQLLRRLRPLALVAPEQQEVEKAVTERLATERGPARRTHCRKQLGSIMQRIQILAYHPGVVERRTVV